MQRFLARVGARLAQALSGGEEALADHGHPVPLPQTRTTMHLCAMTSGPDAPQAATLGITTGGTVQ